MNFGKLNLLGIGLALALRELAEDFGANRNVARVAFVAFLGVWMTCTHFIRRKRERAKKQ
jgi:hypothetical protein